MPLFATAASSPVARDHWGIFELIIKESGDEGSDGMGRTFPSSLPRASRVLASSPGKACGGDSCDSVNCGVPGRNIFT